MLIAHPIRSLSATLLGAVAIATASSGPAPAQGPPSPEVPAARPDRPEIPTVVAHPVTTTEVRNENAKLTTPQGITVHKEAARPMAPTSVVSRGARVKKGDVLYRFDPAPLRADLARFEADARLKEERFREAEAAEIAAKARHDDHRSDLESRRQEARDAVIEGGKAAVARAEARVRRHRDANDLVAKKALDPDDPMIVAQALARLDLLDRLDEAEAHLDRERARFLALKAETPASEVGDDPKSKRLAQEHAEADRALVDARKERDEARVQEREVRDALSRCEVRSPADGIVADAWRDEGGFPIEPASFVEGVAIEGTRPLCRILTGPEPLQTIRFYPVGPGGSMLRYTRPGQALVVGFQEPGPGGRPLRRTAPATLVDRYPVDRRGYQIEAATPDTPIFAVIRLDAPMASLQEVIDLEFPVDLPTGVVRIPSRAVDGGQVAVRGPDGTFRWRNVQVDRQDGEEAHVGKMLGEGEVVALDPVAAMVGKPRPEATTNRPQPAPAAPPLPPGN